MHYIIKYKYFINTIIFLVSKMNIKIHNNFLSHFIFNKYNIFHFFLVISMWRPYKFFSLSNMKHYVDQHSRGGVNVFPTYLITGAFDGKLWCLEQMEHILDNF